MLYYVITIYSKAAGFIHYTSHYKSLIIYWGNTDSQYIIYARCTPGDKPCLIGVASIRRAYSSRDILYAIVFE